MITENILTQLRQLKLSGMSMALQGQIEQPGTYEGLSFEERIQFLIEQEFAERSQRKQQRLIRAAKFKIQANAHDIDYLHPRGLKQSQMAALLQCDWIAKGQNLLLSGPCGSGKTWLSCAIGHTACMKGYSVRYYRISRLLLELTQSKADGSYSKFLNSLNRYQLLILDDWGLEPLKAAQRNDLLEIMDDRHGALSTAMLSQLPTDQWYHAIGDNTLADAILDRLMHNAHRINLKGESMRKQMNNIE
ncbi:MAG: IS21-like element helper ATPase IstB [Methanosarcinaceae archaeon]